MTTFAPDAPDRQDMPLPLDTWVQVYRNLNRACWSVRVRGKVVAHAKSLTLKNVTLIIQPAGQARVRSSGQKNVHAYARGMVDPWTAAPLTQARVHYNPETRDTFELEDGTPIEQCSVATFDVTGRMLINVR